MENPTQYLLGILEDRTITPQSLLEISSFCHRKRSLSSTQNSNFNNTSPVLCKLIDYDGNVIEEEEAEKEENLLDHQLMFSQNQLLNQVYEDENNVFDLKFFVEDVVDPEAETGNFQPNNQPVEFERASNFTRVENQTQNQQHNQRTHSEDRRSQTQSHQSQSNQRHRSERSDRSRGTRDYERETQNYETHHRHNNNNNHNHNNNSSSLNQQSNSSRHHSRQSNSNHNNNNYNNNHHHQSQSNFSRNYLHEDVIRLKDQT